MTGPRFLFDVSTVLRHWENADGISRTVAKLAAFAAEHLPNVQFVYLVGSTTLRVKSEYVRAVLAGDCRIDLSYFPDPLEARLRHKMPRPLRSALLWIQRPRRQAIVWADRVASRSTFFKERAERLRSRLLNAKYRRVLAKPDGQPVRLIHHNLAFASMPPPKREDVLVLPGSDWVLMSRLMQAREKPKVAALCYDIVPLLFPQFFRSRFVGVFRACVEEVYSRADLTIFTAHQIMVDTHGYWRERGLPSPESAIVPLGADVRETTDALRSLPEFLAKSRFALFVSTIEPRKNHRMLFEVWKALTKEGVPQQHGFSLVFVGREGWMTEDLLLEMRAHATFGSTLHILSDVDDQTLDALYEACAFTVYPSLYEGFGLPIIESFLRGKAVIASAAGALKETVDGLSPCLDPLDETAWRETLRSWIREPALYKAYEKLIRSRYKPRSWDEAARHFFRTIGQRLEAPNLALPDKSLEMTL